MKVVEARVECTATSLCRISGPGLAMLEFMAEAGQTYSFSPDEK
jgi:alpha-L-fucosidase 2